MEKNNRTTTDSNSGSMSRIEVLFGFCSEKEVFGFCSEKELLARDASEEGKNNVCTDETNRTTTDSNSVSIRVDR